MSDGGAGLAGLIGAFGTIFVIYLVIKYAVSAGVKNAGGSKKRTSPSKNWPTRGDASEEAEEFDPFADEPGRFVVEGVDIETQHDVRLFINAASPEAARVKVKLQGIEPTIVRRA